MGRSGSIPFAVSAALIRYLGTVGLEIRSVLTPVQQEVLTLHVGSSFLMWKADGPSLFSHSPPLGLLPEREHLLLAVADVTPDIDDEVGRPIQDMPLAPLSGTLVAAVRCPADMPRSRTFAYPPPDARRAWR